MRNILAPFRLDIFEGDAQQAVIDVVAAEMRVAVGCEDFEDAVVQLEDRDVESAAAEIVDGDDAFLALVETVGERGGCWLVDQAQNFETGDAAGIARGLPLRVVEVGGNGDDGLRYRSAQRGFGVLLQLPQDERGDLRRRESLLAQPTRITDSLPSAM